MNPPGGTRSATFSSAVTDPRSLVNRTVAPSSLTAGAWNTITVTVPANAVTPLYQLGVQFTTGAAWTGTCYIDTVSW